MRLGDHIETLICELLPVRMSSTAAVGSVNNEAGQSLRVYLRGARRGHWCDFATGEHGDALDLVAAVLFSGDLGAGYRWALEWLEIDRAKDHTLQPAARQPAPKTSDHDLALAIWRQTRPAPGTLTDLWLRRRSIRFAIPAQTRHHNSLPYREDRRVRQVASDGRAPPRSRRAVCRNPEALARLGAGV